METIVTGETIFILQIDIILKKYSLWAEDFFFEKFWSLCSSPKARYAASGLKYYSKHASDVNSLNWIQFWVFFQSWCDLYKKKKKNIVMGFRNFGLKLYCFISYMLCVLQKNYEFNNLIPLTVTYGVRMIRSIYIFTGV